jgi:hypothetical protein
MPQKIYSKKQFDSIGGDKKQQTFLARFENKKEGPKNSTKVKFIFTNFLKQQFSKIKFQPSKATFKTFKFNFPKFDFKLNLFKKRKISFVLATLSLVIVVGITSVFIFNKKIQAATYGFIQSSWAGGASNNTATHDLNRNNWTNYESSSGITAGTDLKLTRDSF